MDIELDENIRSSMRSYSITPPTSINQGAIGKYIRFNTSTGSVIKGGKNGWYTMTYSKKGELMCAWGDWGNPELKKVLVFSDSETRQPLSAEEQKKANQEKLNQERFKKDKAEKAKKKVYSIFNGAKNNQHAAYLYSKGFSAQSQDKLNVLTFNQSLIVPVYSLECSNPINLQMIFPKKPTIPEHYPSVKAYRMTRVALKAGKLFWKNSRFNSIGFEKRFIKDAPKKGGYFIIGQKDQKIRDNVMYGLAEGYATAITICETLEIPVIICFDVDNLKSFIRKARFKHPDSIYLNFADNDLKTDLLKPYIGNPGMCMAEELKTFYQIKYVFPQWEESEALQGNSDFNDYEVLHGKDALRAYLEAQISELIEEKPITSKPFLKRQSSSTQSSVEGLSSESLESNTPDDLDCAKAYNLASRIIFKG